MKIDLDELAAEILLQEKYISAHAGIDDREDLSQQAFLEIAAGKGQPVPLGGYTHQVLRYHLIRLYEARRKELYGSVLAAIAGLASPRDREVLERFYLNSETHLDIERDMHLSDTQFRLLKSRALAKVRESIRLGERRGNKQIAAKFAAMRDIVTANTAQSEPV